MYTAHVAVLRSVAALELQLLQLHLAACQMKSRGSAVGITNGYGLEDRGV